MSILNVHLIFIISNPKKTLSHFTHQTALHLFVQFSTRVIHHQVLLLQNQLFLLIHQLVHLTAAQPLFPHELQQE